jgi:hypothetical protein
MNKKNVGILFLFLCLTLFFNQQTWAQSIPGTGTSAGICGNCNPTGWADADPALDGTPDISNRNQAGGNPTAGFGATWSAAPLPLPPTGDVRWITLRDVGASTSIEENVTTTMTGLTIGRTYKLVINTMTSTTNSDGGTGGTEPYAGTFIEDIDVQVGSNPRRTLVIPATSQNTWGTNTIIFIATATSETFTVFPGSDSGFDGTVGSLNLVEMVHLSVDGVTALERLDTDGDGVFDDEDIDDDNDGILDVTESGGNDPNGDEDGDGIPNYLDVNDDGTGDGSTTDYTDSNADGFPDAFDFDRDGIPNHLDLDADNDGILDNVEFQTTAGYTAPSGSVGTNGYYDIYETSADSGTAANAPVNTDGTFGADYLDIDADDDGIPDNVEAQTTLGYSAPSGNVGNNGVDSSYENVDTYSPTGITITDTDLDGTLDYRDSDSDNDGTNDIDENGEGNVLSGSDLDGDGLDNNFDADNVNYDPNDNINVPSTDLPDADGDVNTDGDVDFRDDVTGLDSDDDGIPDSVDIDDDDDGILDTAEGLCSGGSLTTASRQLGAGPVDDTQNIDLTSLGVSIGGQVTITNLLADGDLSAGNAAEVFSLSINGGTAITDLTSDVQCEGTLTAVTTNITQVVDVIDIGSGVPGITLRVQYGASVNAICSGNTIGLEYTVDITCDRDTDADGIIDSLDIDSDNDGIPDFFEAQSTSGFQTRLGVDADGDGLDDRFDDNLSGSSGSNGITSGEFVNTDGDAFPDHLDIDADGDGIPDNVEAQSTLGYMAPNGVPGENGLDSAYDFNDAFTNTGLGNTLINTDGDAEPDYRDTDSDADGTNDIAENGDTDNTASGTDTDGDGLDDNFDDVSGFDVNDDNDNPSMSLGDADADVNSGGDVDYRDDLAGTDTDGDGITDNVDIDDDNDGILDVDEGFCTPNTVVTDENFETTSWTTSGTATTGTFVLIDPVATTYQPEDDASTTNTLAFITGQNSGGAIGTDDVDGGTSIALSPVYSLTNSGTFSLMYFFGQRDAGDDSTGDFFTIETSNDGGSNWTEILRIGDVTSSPVWTNITGDIPSGSSFRIRVTASDGATEGDIIEAGIDDLYIEEDCSRDTDGDLIPDYLDQDSDGDGILDVIEAQTSSGYVAPSGSVGANGLYDIYESDDTPSATGLTPVNTDSATESVSVPDYLDIDSDNDGIPDNVEAQSTQGYMAPSGTVGSNGVDVNYELNDSFTTTALDPINFDSAGEPDFRDTDSDGDGTLDENESGITANGGGTADADGDGLLDNWEGSDATAGEAYDVNDEINDPVNNLLDEDGDGNSTGDVDYRDTASVPDTDGDGITDDVDIDDDNDGVLDIDEGCDSNQSSIPFADEIFLISGDPGIVYRYDVLTTTRTQIRTLSTRHNAMAYNTNDGLIWMNDRGASPNRLRLYDPNDSWNEVTSGIPVTQLPNVISATYDPIKKQYVANSSSLVYILDGDPDSPTYATVLRTFANTIANGFTDIAFNPNDGYIYGIRTNTPSTADAQLIRINTQDDTTTNIGDVTGLPRGSYGRAFYNSDGLMYFIRNSTLVLYSIDLSVGQTATQVSTLTGLSTSANGRDAAGIPGINFNNQVSCRDTDGDGIPDALDIDSDNDGIPDNVEAQLTSSYIAPSGSGSGITDNNNNGLDDNYESGQGGTDITPVNTDEITGNNTDALPDYLDTDTDGDGVLDINENGNANSLSGTDTDGDGLDDAFEGVLNDNDVNDDIDDPTTNLPDLDSDVNTPDGSQPNAAEYNDVDYRDIDDDRTAPSVVGNILWLRGDIGVTGTAEVTNWADQSGSGFNAVPNGLTGPIKLGDADDGGLNFNPTLQFTGTQGLDIVNGILGTSVTYTDLWIYSVNSSTSATTLSNIVNQGVSGGTDITYQVPTAGSQFSFNPATGTALAAAWGGIAGSTDDAFSLWNAGFSSASTTPSGQFKTIYRDGLQVATNNDGTNFSSDNSNLSIGTDLLDTNFFSGEIAEIMVFTSVPSALEQQQIQSYLAIKYGITLDQTDNDATIDEGDYILEDLTTVVWDESANSAYHNGVAGIGRDDGMFLNQKQSTSKDADAIVTIGLGSIAGNNSLNSSSINANKSFLMWGHNGTTVDNVNTSSVSLLCENELQLDRVWKIVETGTIGSVEVAVPQATLDLALTTPTSEVIVMKVADNASFTTNVKHIPVTTRTINGVVNYVVDYNFNGTKYFTYSEVLGIFWNGDTATWTGGAGTAGAPSIDPSIDGGKVLVIDAETSGTNAILTASANVECLWVKPNSKLVVSNDLFIEFDQDFVLDGEVRLIGDAQLVQSHTGLSNVEGNGVIFRDQQATVPSVYRYHYWSSPVVAALGNTTYSTSTVMFDGTIPTSENSTARAINWQSWNGNLSSLNGAPTDPITIATWWVYSFFNGVTRDDWTQKLHTGSINIAEGFIMKSTGRSPQNFTFMGSPNDGTYTKVLTPGTTSLLGNPYPSVINSQEFLTDNDDVIDGTLYFWEHQGETTTTSVQAEGHGEQGYIGGYSQRNQAMGVAANSVVDGTAGLGAGSYTSPPQFIAVAQGFFVSAPANKGGTLRFENSQRTASTDNFFFRNNDPTEDLPKLKIGMDYISETDAPIHRQLGINFKEGHDFTYQSGFDSQVFDLQPTDMFWDFEEIESNLVIAGVGELSADLQVPLGFQIDSDFPVKVMLDETENMEGYDIYLGDLVTGRLYNLETPVDLDLPKGTYSGRFILMFGGEALSNGENPLLQGFNVFMNNETDQIIIRNNNNSVIKKVELFNILGQPVKMWENLDATQVQHALDIFAPTAIYVVKVTTERGEITRKILID